MGILKKSQDVHQPIDIVWKWSLPQINLPSHETRLVILETCVVFGITHFEKHPGEKKIWEAKHHSRANLNLDSRAKASVNHITASSNLWRTSELKSNEQSSTETTRDPVLQMLLPHPLVVHEVFDSATSWNLELPMDSRKKHGMGTQAHKHAQLLDWKLRLRLPLLGLLDVISHESFGKADTIQVALPVKCLRN